VLRNQLLGEASLFLSSLALAFKMIQDELVRKAIQVIGNTARTGKIGDGKVFVVAIEEAVRIRTGERGLEAV
jgi:nitrogen regulatory protein PII